MLICLWYILTKVKGNLTHITSSAIQSQAQYLKGFWLLKRTYIIVRRCYDPTYWGSHRPPEQQIQVILHVALPLATGGLEDPVIFLESVASRDALFRSGKLQLENNATYSQGFRAKPCSHLQKAIILLENDYFFKLTGLGGDWIPALGHQVIIQSEFRPWIEYYWIYIIYKHTYLPELLKTNFLFTIFEW